MNATRTTSLLIAAGLLALTAQAQTKPPRNQLANAATTPAARKPAKKETFSADQIRALVEQTLAKNPYYAPGHLISRRDAEPILEKLRQENITSPDDQESLGGSLLPDQSFLVTRLKTPAGRAFMKKVMSDPTSLDRLERLSWTVDGRRLIDGYLSSADGAARFQQLRTAAQLAKLSKQWAADSRTADFELPTGHVHTAADLIARLEEVLDRQNPAE